MRLLLASLVVALSVGPAGRAHANNATARPNIVFVLADDLGWSELGCYGNDFNETPHLNQLASKGMRFTQAYSAAPVCSPYRAALLTGQYPARIGMTDYLRPNSANALSTDHVTLAEMLQSAGYATGMIGKWHLTGYESHEAEFEITPRDHGFDWDFARERKGVANGVNFWPYLDRTQGTRWLDISENRLGEEEFLVDRMNLEATRFIERNKDRPFFLYLSHYAPHSIVNGKPELVEKYRNKRAPGKSSKSRCVICSREGHDGCPLHHWATDHNPHLAAMLESIDDGIGMITRKLEELGLAENTIVIFTSDNGGETNVTDNAPLRGGKSQLYEGGIRVPMIVRWPSQVPSAAVCEQPTMNTDFYPTLLDATGVELSPTHVLDGVSTIAAWREPSAPIERRTLYWHYPLDRPHFLGGVSAGAVRDGDWKLIEFFDDDRTELYHLTDDPSEQTDLAAENRELVDRLKEQLADWRSSRSARHPSPPLLTETRQLSFADHFSSNRASERWHFTKDWSAGDGVLKRSDHGTETTRIFLRDAEYKDVVIRFDFQLQQAEDLRLVTGSSGHYNAVIHIRRDHFFVQTAKDDSGPYFSYRHGECAYEFDPRGWYTMTVEFIGDQLVAHIDHQHLVYAKHPILDKQRTYFAFQVDEHPAALDNVQILRAVTHPDQAANLDHITSVYGKHPVEMPVAKRAEIQKRNAHEWFYQRDDTYRQLVHRVDDLDRQMRELFPEAFRSHKEFRKRITEQKKTLLADDPTYKETLFATYRAERAITQWLTQQEPDVENLPDSRRKRELERLRRRHQHTLEYQRLVAARDAAQQQLENAYPHLFITDEEIHRSRAAKRDEVKKNPLFEKLTKERAAAYRAQQAYLFSNDAKLADLQRQLDDGQK